VTRRVIPMTMLKVIFQDRRTRPSDERLKTRLEVIKKEEEEGKERSQKALSCET